MVVYRRQVDEWNNEWTDVTDELWTDATKGVGRSNGLQRLCSVIRGLPSAPPERQSAVLPQAWCRFCSNAAFSFDGMRSELATKSRDATTYNPITIHATTRHQPGWAWGLGSGSRGTSSMSCSISFFVPVRDCEYSMR